MPLWRLRRGKGLPATGNRVGLWVGVGATAVLVGAGLFYLGLRRRRTA